MKGTSRKKSGNGQFTSRIWRKYRTSELDELENKRVSNFQPFLSAKYFKIKIQPGDCDQSQSMTWPQSRDQIKLMDIRFL